MRLDSLVLEITKRCMNNCLYCSSSATSSSEEYLDLDTAARFAEEARRLGLKEIYLSGGEPLLHPNVVDFVNQLHLLGLRVSMFTSGIVADSDGRPVPYTHWRSPFYRLHRIVFDIQSNSAVIHDKLADRVGAFHQTLTSAQYAISQGFHVECSCVPNEINLDSLYALSRLAQSSGFLRISFLAFVPQGRAELNRSKLELNDIAQNTLVWKLFFVVNSQELSDIEVRIGAPLAYTGLSEARCTLCKSKLLVKPTGQVTPCEAIKVDERYFLGHIATHTPQQCLEIARSHELLKELRRDAFAPSRQGFYVP